MGLLTVVDGQALAGYCQAWAEFEAATKTIQAEGRTIKEPIVGTVDGVVEVVGNKIKPHPAVAQHRRSAWAAIRAFASLFGFDPSSRSRMHVPGQAAEDELAAFHRVILPSPTKRHKDVDALPGRRGSRWRRDATSTWPRPSG